MNRAMLVLMMGGAMLGTNPTGATDPLDRLTSRTLVGTWEGLDRYYEHYLRLSVKRGDDSRLHGTLSVASVRPSVAGLVFVLEDIEVIRDGAIRFGGRDDASAIGLVASGEGSASEERGLLTVSFQFHALFDRIMGGSVLAGGSTVDFVKGDGTVVERLAGAAARSRDALGNAGRE